MESLEGLADEISSMEQRVSDVMYDALRAQVRGDNAQQAKDLERRLARVRRSLQKAAADLRSSTDD